MGNHYFEDFVLSSRKSVLGARENLDLGCRPLPHLVWGESRSVSEEVAVVTCSVRNGVIGCKGDRVWCASLAEREHLTLHSALRRSAWAPATPYFSGSKNPRLPWKATSSATPSMCSTTWLFCGNPGLSGSGEGGADRSGAIQPRGCGLA